ncbi:MAG: class I SAM-dependent methyltransferase [Burkholderiales bacterium]|nr:class I SAM-dependent methyltransferase [Burkholderiales bacterium]
MAVTLSAVYAQHTDTPKTTPQDAIFERICVSPSRPEDTTVRWSESQCDPVRRLNIGVGLARGDWVAIVPSSTRVPHSVYTFLADQLSGINTGAAVCVWSSDQSPLLFVQRRSFVYGGLDERVVEHAAPFDWLFNIYLSAGRRVFDLNGITVLTVTGLPEVAAESVLSAIQTQLADPASTRAPNSPQAKKHDDYQPQQFWESNTREYIRWEIYQPDEADIEQQVERFRPERVLELGAGAGRNIRYFQGALSYVGLDIAHNLLMRARDRIDGRTQRHLVVSDASRLCFADKRFDFLFADSTLQHLTPEMMQRAAAEMARVCSGHIVLLEYVAEKSPDGRWFAQSHVFAHDYATLFAPYATLRERKTVTTAVQEAVKQLYVFEVN